MSRRATRASDGVLESRDGDDELVGVVCALHERPTAWTTRQLAILDGAAQLVAAGISHDAARVRLAGFQAADRHRACLLYTSDAADD